MVLFRDPLNEHAGGFGGGNLSDDDGVVPIGLKVLRQQLRDAAVMAVGDVQTDDGGEPAASLHAVPPIRSHADRETDLAAGLVNRLHHVHLPLHRTHSVDNAKAAHFTHGDAHRVFADRRHIGRNDGNAKGDAGHRRGQIRIGAGIHRAVARDEHDIVERIGFSWFHRSALELYRRTRCTMPVALVPGPACCRQPVSDLHYTGHL